MAHNEPRKRTIDDRLDGLTETLEIAAAMVADIAANQKRDGEHIRGLARIAEIHERRLTHLEGQ
jgi:hypothetical protein